MILKSLHPPTASIYQHTAAAESAVCQNCPSSVLSRIVDLFVFNKMLIPSFCEVLLTVFGKKKSW